jgi:putative ABC transport system permease protein
MRSLISHLRYTVRLLLKSPGFTITAVLILGLGIGANTAIFSLVNCVLLKPLPYPNPNRLVSIYQVFQGDKAQFDYPNYVDYRATQHTFDSLTAYYNDDFTLTGRGEPERISGMYTSGSLFKVLGRPFLIGAPFGETENNSETRSVVVISQHLWDSKFHRDPKVLGTNLLLNGRSFEIVGVTPAEADEWARVDLYVPLNQGQDFNDAKGIRSAFFLSAIGRLKENATLSQARADFGAINEQLRRQYPAANSGTGIRLVPYLDSVINDYSASLWLLEGAVGCLLLITCANVANLLLTRMQERRTELTIRAALGASRTQLIAQSMFETSILALAGGILGVPAAACGVSLIRSVSPDDITRFQEVVLDNGSLMFVLAVTVCTALLAGVLPAWFSSNADPAPALGAGGERSRTSGPLRQKRQSALVVGQVALTFLLLTAAGLLARSYQAVQNQPLGFHTAHILTADVYLPSVRYTDPAKCKAAWNNILGKLRSVPGVTGAALNDVMPFKSLARISFGITGQPDPEPGKAPLSVKQSISPDYFSVLGVPIVRGRAFTDADQGDTQRVVIINQALAEKFFPGQDPIGKQINNLGDKFGGKRINFTIVGVAGDVEHNSPEVQLQLFHAYYPYTQDPWGPTPVNPVTLVLSVNGDPDSLLPAIRKVVASFDPDLPLSNVVTLDQLVAKGFAARRLPMFVVSLFSGAALLLAAIGLYGLLSYSVSQRRRELGIRIALGAQAFNIIQLVINQGLLVGGIGLIIGILSALVLGRFLQGALYHVPSTDPSTLVSAAVVLGLAALSACLLPALRATRINPIKALRE